MLPQNCDGYRKDVGQRHLCTPKPWGGQRQGTVNKNLRSDYSTVNSRSRCCCRSQHRTELSAALLRTKITLLMSPEPLSPFHGCISTGTIKEWTVSRYVRSGLINAQGAWFDLEQPIRAWLLDYALQDHTFTVTISQSRPKRGLLSVLWRSHSVYI